MRTTAPTETNEYGDEVHPAFGYISVNRRSSTPGAILFDSDIRHGHTVVVTISTATRKRDLSRDWIHPGREPLVEVEMSEAQWASFVSSMGTSGVPATLRARESERQLPDLEYDPRLAHSMEEVKNAGQDILNEIRDALKAYEDLDPKAPVKIKRMALRKLHYTIENAQSNIEFRAKSLTEHAENVVQRSRADIEAMAMQAADRMGLPTGTRLLELEEVKNV